MQCVQQSDDERAMYTMYSTAQVAGSASGSQLLLKNVLVFPRALDPNGESVLRIDSVRMCMLYMLYVGLKTITACG